MKKSKTYFKRLLFTLIVLQFFHQNISAQITTQSVLKDLIKTWYLFPDYTYKHPYNPDTLSFQSTTHVPSSMGPRIEIKENQEFVDAYDAECGNDTSIHNTTGKWYFDITTMTFETTIPIDFREKRYKILYLSETKLVLVKSL